MSANMTDVSDVPIFDDGDEERLIVKPVVSASKRMVRHDSSQLPQSFGFSDDRDLRGICHL
jgi:hypothetical protein